MYQKIGDLFSKLGDYGQSKHAYDEAIQNDPKSVLAHMSRGKLAQDHDMYQDAESDFLAATKLDPNNGDAWSGLGVAWMYLEHACKVKESACKP